MMKLLLSHHAIVLLSTSIAVYLAASPPTIAQQTVILEGAGATLPAPLYEHYARQIKQQFPNIKLNYQPIGSRGGIRQIIAGTVDFGGSDIGMTQQQMAQVKRGVLLVPTAGSAVAVAYNLPGIDTLKLSRQVLPAIFVGQITQWDDPQIRADNPGIKLPNSSIKVVVRADSSGTTLTFTHYLSAISPDFNRLIGASLSPTWPSHIVKAKGGCGVACTILQYRNSISYVEFGYVKQNQLQVAQVQNRSGQFVLPSVAEADRALAAVPFPNNTSLGIGDPLQGYPIVELTWLMIYKRYASAAKANAIKQMVQWILTSGQALNTDLDYARIPTPIARRTIATVNAAIKP